MNIGELKSAVVNATGLGVGDSDKAVKAVFDAMANALHGGDSINIVGFGVFSVGERAARTGRNPRTGEELQIPAAKTVKFKVGKALKDKVNG